MASDLAIVGEFTELIVRTDQPIKDKVDVHFEGTVPGSPPVKWNEPNHQPRMVSQEANKQTYVITWKANWKGTDAQLASAPQLRFTVHGESQGGGKVIGSSVDVIALRRPIEITTNVDLIRIMLHEFASPTGSGGFQLNKSPLVQFLSSLTIQQKKLLLDHPAGSSGNRLVALITLYPPTPARLIGADFTDSSAAAIPNACFSVFHCQGPGKIVTLVCHTEHFLVNEHNPDTQVFLKNPQLGVPAEKWQSKKKSATVMFKIAALEQDGEFMSSIVVPCLYMVKT